MDLIDAIIANDKTRVFEMLLQGADFLETDDSDGVTPLHHAVSGSDIEIIFILIEYGANPYKRYAKNSQTAFELACSLCRNDVISLFCNLNKSKLLQ